MQHMILIISQIKKEKHYKEHDENGQQNLNMNYMLNNDIESMFNFMHPNYVRQGDDDKMHTRSGWKKPKHH